MSHVTFHLSCVTCQVSNVNFHISKRKIRKLAWLVSGASVTGDNQSSVIKKNVSRNFFRVVGFCKQPIIMGAEGSHPEGGKLLLFRH